MGTERETRLETAASLVADKVKEVCAGTGLYRAEVAKAVVEAIKEGEAGTDSLHECQNCGGVFVDTAVGKLSEIPHLLDRVAPGEVMPSGECPKCGALTHEQDDNTTEG